MVGASAQRVVAREGDNQLVVEGVSKRFGGVTAVQDVSLDVPRGSILSIIGPNGAGKTSLLNMISGFYKPDTGRIVLEGRDITQQEAERHRRARRRAHLPEHRPVQRPHRARQPDARPPRAHEGGRAGAASSTGAWRRRKTSRHREACRGDHRVPEAPGPAQAADRGAAPTACASASSSAARWRSSPRCCCSTSRWAA